MKPAWLIVPLLALLPFPAAHAKCLHFDIPDVTLRGRIERGELQLAPEFRNRDLQESDYRWSMRVDAPICLSEKGNEPVGSFNRFEIFPGDSGTAQFAHMDGQTVEVTGHFLPTWIPHYHEFPIFVATSIAGVSGKTP